MTLEELEQYLEKCLESEIYLFWYAIEFNRISPQWTRVSFTTPDNHVHPLDFRYNRVLKPTEETKVTSIKLTYLQDQLKYQLGNVKDLRYKSEINGIKREEVEEDKREVLSNLTQCVNALGDEIECLEVLAESFKDIKFPNRKNENQQLADVLNEYIDKLKDKVLPGIKNLKVSVEAM